MGSSSLGPARKNTTASRLLEHDEDALLEAYLPEWTQEEEQRQEAWFQFLLENACVFCPEGGKFDSLRSLCDSVLQDILLEANEHGNEALKARLAELVMDGLPMEIRGLAWKTFLDLSVRRQRGYYAELTQRALKDLANKQHLDGEEIKAHMAGSVEQHAQLHGIPLSGTDFYAPAPAGSSRATSPAPVATSERPSGDSQGPQPGTGGSGAVADDLLQQPMSPTEHSDPSYVAWLRSGRTWLQQIEKDLPRTFPGHPVMEGAGRVALRRVLAAYALHNPAIGYCQGMNFVVAVLLMFLNEEDAFYCLAVLVEDILAGYYSPDMMATQVDQHVFKQLVAKELPQVSSHLEDMGTDISCVSAQWFLCAFVTFLPLEACLRVWDLLFLRRSGAVLFQVALALMDIYSSALMLTSDVIEALQVAQNLAPLTHDGTRLVTVAAARFGHVDEAALKPLREAAHKQVAEEAAVAAANAARMESERAAARAQAAAAASSTSSTGPHQELGYGVDGSRDTVPTKDRDKDRDGSKAGGGEGRIQGLRKMLLSRLEKGKGGGGAGKGSSGALGTGGAGGDVGEDSDGEVTGTASGAGAGGSSAIPAGHHHQQHKLAASVMVAAGTPLLEDFQGKLSASTHESLIRPKTPGIGSHPLGGASGSGSAPATAPPTGVAARAKAAAAGLKRSLEARVGSKSPAPQAAGEDSRAGAQGEGGEEEDEGTYQPPTIALFPEAPELITLSPEASVSASALIPDIDDLLGRVASGRHPLSPTPASPTPPADHPQDDDEPDLDATQSAATAGGAVDGSQSQAAGTHAAAGSAAAGEVPAAEVQSGSSPGPQDVKGKHTLVQLKKNDRLKHIDSMLWDNPNWDSQAAAPAGVQQPPAAPDTAGEGHVGPTAAAAGGLVIIGEGVNNGTGGISAPGSAQPQPARLAALLEAAVGGSSNGGAGDMMVAHEPSSGVETSSASFDHAYHHVDAPPSSSSQLHHTDTHHDEPVHLDSRGEEQWGAGAVDLDQEVNTRLSPGAEEVVVGPLEGGALQGSLTEGAGGSTAAEGTSPAAGAVSSTSLAASQLVGSAHAQQPRVSRAMQQAMQIALHSYRQELLDRKRRQQEAAQKAAQQQQQAQGKGTSPSAAGAGGSATSPGTSTGNKGGSGGLKTGAMSIPQASGHATSTLETLTSQGEERDDWVTIDDQHPGLHVGSAQSGISFMGMHGSGAHAVVGSMGAGGPGTMHAMASSPRSTASSSVLLTVLPGGGVSGSLGAVMPAASSAGPSGHGAAGGSAFAAGTPSRLSQGIIDPLPAAGNTLPGGPGSTVTPRLPATPAASQLQGRALLASVQQDMLASTPSGPHPALLPPLGREGALAPSGSGSFGGAPPAPASTTGALALMGSGELLKPPSGSGAAGGAGATAGQGVAALKQRSEAVQEVCEKHGVASLVERTQSLYHRTEDAQATTAAAARAARTTIAALATLSQALSSLRPFLESATAGQPADTTAAGSGSGSAVNSSPALQGAAAEIPRVLHALQAAQAELEEAEAAQRAQHSLLTQHQELSGELCEKLQDMAHSLALAGQVEEQYNQALMHQNLQLRLKEGELADKSDTVHDLQQRLAAAQRQVAEHQALGLSGHSQQGQGLVAEVGSKLRNLRFRSGSRPSSPAQGRREGSGSQPPGGAHHHHHHHHTSTSDMEMLGGSSEGYHHHHHGGGSASGSGTLPTSGGGGSGIRWGSATREGRAGSALSTVGSDEGMMGGGGGKQEEGGLVTRWMAAATARYKNFQQHG